MKITDFNTPAPEDLGILPGNMGNAALPHPSVDKGPQGDLGKCARVKTALLLSGFLAVQTQVAQGHYESPKPLPGHSEATRLSKQDADTVTAAKAQQVGLPARCASRLCTLERTLAVLSAGADSGLLLSVRQRTVPP